VDVRTAVGMAKQAWLMETMCLTMAPESVRQRTLHRLLARGTQRAVNDRATSPNMCVTEQTESASVDKVEARVPT